jgi:hypothetical protein
MTTDRSIRHALALAATAVALALTSPAAGLAANRMSTVLPLGTCTIAAPPSPATVEVEIANAADFCELLSHALAGEVFHAPVVVTPGRLWHYADADLSCRLRYRGSRARVTIRHSRTACRWFRRVAPEWRSSRSGHDAPLAA